MKTSHRIGLYLGVILFLAATVWGISAFVGDKLPTSLSADVGKVLDTDWTEGNVEAKISLVEYSDFQCPACAYYAEIVKQIMNEFGEHVVLIYRHFPLDIHKNSIPAARAAEAAGRQGKFWEMHDMLFDRQSDWSAEINPEQKFTQYADQLKLDTAQFLEDYNSSATISYVEESLNSALSMGLTYTPTFILNGKIIKPNSYDDFRNIVRDAVEKIGS